MPPAGLVYLQSVFFLVHCSCCAFSRLRIEWQSQMLCYGVLFKIFLVVQLVFLSIGDAVLLIFLSFSKHRIANRKNIEICYVVVSAQGVNTRRWLQILLQTQKTLKYVMLWCQLKVSTQEDGCKFYSK